MVEILRSTDFGCILKIEGQNVLMYDMYSASEIKGSEVTSRCSASATEEMTLPVIKTV